MASTRNSLGTRSFGLILGPEQKRGAETRTIRSPYDDHPVGEVRFGDQETLGHAIDLAVEMFAGFRMQPSYRRSAYLATAADCIEDQAELFATAICDEAGKPMQLAREEAVRAATTVRIAAQEALRIHGEYLALDQVPDGEGRSGLVRRVPRGPVGAITPYNAPLNLVAHKVAAAIAAGTTIVLKPASQTPMSALLLGRLLLEAGLPPGVFNVIPCSADDAAPLVEDPRLRMLTFTGSAEVGWALKARAGRKKVLLELGGNTAAIVEPDCDVDVAARKLARGAFLNAGQNCLSVQRIFVHERISRRFLDTFLAVAHTEIPCGDPSDSATLCGPLIDGGNADRILEWIDQAVAANAGTLLKAQRTGNVISPTVLTQVPTHLPIVAQEVFGPVVVLETYRGLNTGLKLANGTDFGLQTAIFTRDIRKLMRAYDQLEVGAVIHNDYPSYRLDPMPFGGVKSSGVGREGPRYAIEEMTERRLLVLQHGP